MELDSLCRVSDGGPRGVVVPPTVPYRWSNDALGMLQHAVRDQDGDVLKDDGVEIGDVPACLEMFERSCPARERYPFGKTIRLVDDGGHIATGNRQVAVAREDFELFLCSDGATGSSHKVDEVDSPGRCLSCLQPAIGGVF